ncbi:MAG: helix-turn-helix domain-containing protein [Bacillota bacterium]|nr:helix-turn-helix domain-containing protein [Bacillota bacterium]
MGLKENIKLYRKNCGLTLEEVAKYLDVSRQTVQKYESGVVLNISSDKIEKMAKLFNVSPAQLIGWDISNNNKQKSPMPESIEENLKTAELKKLLNNLNPDKIDEALAYVKFLYHQQQSDS